MTDTEDYFDYALTLGFDPMNYSSFGAYWRALQKNIPVANYTSFSPQGKVNWFRDFRDRVNAYRRAQMRRAKAFPKIVKAAGRRRTIKHSVRNAIRVSRRKVAKPLGKKAHEVKITKTEQKLWNNIQKKSIAQKKFTKTENTLIRKTRLTRVWEIRKLQKVDMKTAWKQVQAELDF